MKAFYSWKIKIQIQAALIFMAVCSAVVLGVFTYRTTKRVIEENYREDFSYNLKVSDNITEIQLEGIIGLERELLTNMRFLSAMDDSSNEEGRYFSSGIAHTLESIVGRTILQEVMLDEMIIVDNKGKFYSYSKRSSEGQYMKYYRGENILNESWVETAQLREGREVFYGYNVLNPKEDADTISLTKYLVNPYTKEGMGYMVVNIRTKLFDKAFGTNLNSNEKNYFMIIDEKSQYPVIYFRGEEANKKSIVETYLNGQSGNRGYIFTEMVNDTTGWKLVSIIEQKELNRDSVYIGGVILAVITALVLVGCYLSSVISGRIYDPLNKLELLIEEVGEGNRNITEEFDQSEIGQLGKKFKSMVNNNLDLRERLLSTELKEREAELLLLQSQINPHFLYNTLDSLYCMAVIHEVDDIAEMVSALSNTFRLSLNKGNNLIRMEDEVSHIKSYMDIQNMRYNNRFDLHLHMEKSLSQIYILKFILQPFVENAMYHGLEAKMGRGSIRVNGRVEQEDIIFTIEDDGVGIVDLSVLDKGYGVQNVIERIHLFYGEQYGVEFESEMGKGTKVTITISATYEKGKITDESSGSN